MTCGVIDVEMVVPIDLSHDFGVPMAVAAQPIFFGLDDLRQSYARGGSCKSEMLLETLRVLAPMPSGLIVGVL